MGVQDVLARFKEKHAGDWGLLPQKAIFQMNDTHPTIAVAELMRLLIDQEGLDWDTAWDITKQVPLPPTPPLQLRTIPNWRTVPCHLCMGALDRLTEKPIRPVTGLLC